MTIEFEHLVFIS